MRWTKKNRLILGSALLMIPLWLQAGGRVPESLFKNFEYSVNTLTKDFWGFVCIETLIDSG
jgi:hypothetical protein